MSPVRNVPEGRLEYGNGLGAALLFASNGVRYWCIGIISFLVYLLVSIQSGCLPRGNSSGSSGVPNAPLNLVAVATLSSRINLYWTDNSSNETGFIIERKRQGESGFSILTSVNADVNSYSNTNLSSETFYYYRVRAYNSGGNSAYSNEANNQTLPGPPESPILTQANTFSFQQIDLRWQDNSFNEEGFRIERKTTLNGTYSVITTVATDVISFSDTSLLPQTKYYYRLRAYNFLGDSSNSNELSATTQPLPPAAPSALTCTANAGTPYQIWLQWSDNSNNETGFKIERKTGEGNFQEITNRPANTTSWIDTSVLPDTTYSYQIYGWNAGGYGGFSDVASLTTPSWLPLAPDQLEAWTVAASQINLQWRDNSNNETEFRIERSLTGLGSWTEIATTTDNTTLYNSCSLSPSTTYYYRVRAYDSVGVNYSDYSDVASDTTDPPPAYNPAAPSTPMTSTVYGYELTIQFTDQSTNEEGFIIERQDNGAGPFVEIAQISAVSSSGSTVSYTDQTVTSTTTYYYRLTAYNSYGNSAPPATSTAITTKGPPPLAPSALSGTAISYSQVSLEWDDNSGDEQSFKLERKKAGGSYTQILSLIANYTDYNDNSNIKPETAYYYRIRAFGPGGYSAYSNEINVNTPTGPPAAPMITRLETVSDSQINIFWSDESLNETGFKIERKTEGGLFQEITQVGADVTSHNDNTLAPDTIYYYRIRAYNAYDGLYSGIFSAGTLPLPPNAPSNLTATAVSPVQVNLQWADNSSDETGFALESKTESEPDYYQIANLAANSVSFSHLPLTETTTYYYRIRAWNSVGMSNYSNGVSITTPSASSVTPIAPSGLTATVISSYQINLAWQDNSDNEEGFRINRQSPGDQEFSQVGIVAADVISFSDTALDDLSAYTYTVCAYNIAGASDPSGAITATTITPTWINITTAQAPTARWLHASAYDAEHGQIILFGGWASDYRYDTWLYNGTDWNLQSVSTSPPGRRSHAMAYDAARNIVVLFGGTDSAAKNDIWEWNGINWSEKNPANKPPARSGHALAYDAQRQRVVLFGGVNSGAYFNDTWEWDGANWVNQTPTSNNPPARTGHAFAYDAARQKILLFGGTDTTIMSDTWEWNGSGWTQLNPVDKPSARQYAQMAYDTLRQEIVIFGGQDTGGYLDDTWEWDGANWLEKTVINKPQTRYWHSVTYDSLRQRIVIFGGYNGSSLSDTWEYP